LLEAFQIGDPALAYQAALLLIEAFREQTHELARLRFTLNFGSPVCENCDGLKAGPGVLATCYQTKQCNFDNIKDNANPRHLRVLNTLLGGK
jgi:hypothetical protein